MKHLAHVASRFVTCPLMIHPPKLEVIIKALAPRLGIDPDIVLASRLPIDATATLMARYGDAGEERDYAVIDGIAVIPVQGTLLKKESFMSAWSGATSYGQIQRQVATAIDDASVRAILWPGRGASRGALHPDGRRHRHVRHSHRNQCRGDVTNAKHFDVQAFRLWLH